MKVYLDDVRPTPTGWIRTYTSDETINLLKTGRVTDLSLDHDLGYLNDEDTGYKVVLWLEEQVFINGFIPPINITVHSDNSSAVQKMVSGIASINRKAAENERKRRN